MLSVGQLDDGFVTISTFQKENKILFLELKFNFRSWGSDCQTNDVTILRHIFGGILVCDLANTLVIAISRELLQRRTSIPVVDANFFLHDLHRSQGKGPITLVICCS